LGDIEGATAGHFISYSPPRETHVVASQKKRCKATKLSRQQQQAPSGPFRHKDGDRRRRGGRTADQAMANKRLMQQLGAPAAPDPDEEE
jgi:hypothetical protein